MVRYSAWIQLPNETLSAIAEMLMFDFEPATNIKNFILTCKRAQVIGDPFLYRSVLLGRISDIESFTFFGRSIREGKAHFVKTLEIPDSFPIQTSSTDALMGQSFLGSLINLRELIILQQCEIPFFLIDHPPSTAAPMTLHINQSSTIIITPPNTTFWTAAMFENLPFQLKDLVGTFSNPKTSSALFGAQSSIRRWASIGDLPKQMLKWAVPALQAISFVVGSSIHGSSMQETMSIADLPFRSRLQELGIRGIGRSDLIGDAGLLSFAKITSLSIEMWKCPEVTQEGMLTDIMKCAPELSHLTFKTIGNGAKVTGARRQKIMNQLDPFITLSQVPPMGGLKSMIVIIQLGLVPEVSHNEATALMARSPGLVELDVVSMGGKGRAYIRSKAGQAYQSQNVLCRPCFQNSWF